MLLDSSNCDLQRMGLKMVNDLGTCAESQAGRAVHRVLTKNKHMGVRITEAGMVIGYEGPALVRQSDSSTRLRNIEKSLGSLQSNSQSGRGSTTRAPSGGYHY